MQPSSSARLGEDSRPLKGVRVLDFTRYLAGPYCTMLLADYGADVVRVEPPGVREFRVPGTERDSYFFLSSNRNKRSLTIDLKREEGRALVHRILPGFDIVVENFRPRVMEEIGLGADALVAQHPRLVYCAVSGFGSHGPYANRPGFDQIAQGMSGFMSLTGTVESGPTRAGIAIADVLGGMFAAHGIQLALFDRERTGRGQVVQASLLESMIAVLTWAAGMYFESGRAPGPAGQHHPLASPYGRFRARDGFFNIACANDAMWRKLAPALGHAEWLDDARFADGVARLSNRDALTRAIEAALADHDVAHWVERVNRAGVPAGPVLDLAQVFDDPQVLAREMLVSLPHPVLGTFRTTGLPVKLSRTPGRIDRRPPLLGEHTDEVLRECGLGADEVQALRAANVV
jgi:crotonobetainyl-CoA:carnitine CoA-transferase CaiB-like acyl-CoA transferase